jgi:hypothetical protein
MKVKALLEGAVEIGWFAKVIGNIWTREYQNEAYLTSICSLFFLQRKKFP